MQNLGLIADIIGILGALFALFAWTQSLSVKRELKRERNRINKKVTLILNHGDQKVELPVELRRAELSRAEILGRLGMIPMKEKGKRFSLRYLNTPEFLRQLNQVIDNEGDAILSISCSKEEIKQFDI